MLTIGRLARASGVTTDTIRFYVRTGLLHPPVRNETGYRLYDDTDVRRLAFIRHARGCGLTLQTIRGLMEPHGADDPRASTAQETAQREADGVDRRIAALWTLRAALGAFLRVCDSDAVRARGAPAEVLSEALELARNGDTDRAGKEASRPSVIAAGRHGPLRKTA